MPHLQRALEGHVGVHARGAVPADVGHRLARRDRGEVAQDGEERVEALRLRDRRHLVRASPEQQRHSRLRRPPAPIQGGIIEGIIEEMRERALSSERHG